MNFLRGSSFFSKYHRLLFYSLWIVLGLMQSALTELQDDEAYYWVYSRFLDWGYFDHPPMTALLVKGGYALFPNLLGVRFFPLLLNVCSLMIIEKLVTDKNPRLFYAIVLSIAVLQIIGFTAVPDTPLIFFTALFFWFYKKFTDSPSLRNSFLLGLSIAFLFYSKYHAVLIVFFALLSNIKLLTKYQIYIAGLVALLLFAPHLWWQYQHDWVSFRYHLFESNVNPYKFSFTLDYVAGQLLLPGPIAGLILLPAAFLFQAKNPAEKALRYTMIGIYAFFLISSFRGKVEANWTSPVLISLVVLSHQFLNQQAPSIAMAGQKWLFRLLPFTLGLVLIARIAMVIDIFPLKAVRERYYAWKDWPAEMKQRTRNLPIVFSNSYQRASKYWFYTGQITYSQNHYRERKNNYNFWPIEDSLLGRPVYFLDKYQLFRFPDSLNTPLGWIGYLYDSSLLSFAKIHVEVTPKKIWVKEGAGFNLDCRFVIPKHYSSFIGSHRVRNDTIRIGIFDKQTWIKDVFTALTLQQINENKQTTLLIEPSLPPGRYYLRIAINCGHNNPTHNSDRIELTIE